MLALPLLLWVPPATSYMSPGGGGHHRTSGLHVCQRTARRLASVEHQHLYNIARLPRWQVTSPSGATLFSKVDSAKGKFALTAASDGLHQLCFVNPGTWRGRPVRRRTVGAADVLLLATAGRPPAA